MAQHDGGVMKLFGCLSAWGLPSRSPFVMKIDCYLRMMGLRYERVP
jgi:hypothetical protein